MMYLRKSDRRIIMERFDGGDKLRTKLTAAGFTFDEEDFLRDFWGKRFIIVKPTGKGAQSRMNLLASFD